MSAYYNEFDPYAAEWLRNLIKAGHIAPGDVDSRSITDVSADDLKPYTQCHFFAGIGVWSHALRSSAWADSRPVWTGSCPCQPFSVAGKGEGQADERHLWPVWFNLIEQCRPPVVFGEQVEAAIRHGWLDLVQGDLEGIGYASGAVCIPAGSVGAPHIRQRLWFVAHNQRTGLERHHRDVSYSDEPRRNGAKPIGSTGPSRWVGELGEDSFSLGRRRGSNADQAGNDREIQTQGLGAHGQSRSTGPTDHFWRDADWLLCRDGKWRPVEPGYEQMVDGSARSLGRVRSDSISKIEEEINDWSIRHQANAGETLRQLWQALRAEAICEREIGRFSGVQSPSVLLAFLRQLTEQRWCFSDALARCCAKEPQIVLRVLRFDADASRAPLRRELAEQFAGELADALRELSSIMAHHAAQCWGEACRKKAGAASFPLAQNASARVGRLRAYGNAIVPQVAQEVIESFMEYRP